MVFPNLFNPVYQILNAGQSLWSTLTTADSAVHMVYCIPCCYSTLVVNAKIQIYVALDKQY